MGASVYLFKYRENTYSNFSNAVNSMELLDLLCPDGMANICTVPLQYSTFLYNVFCHTYIMPKILHI
jgi:hypothetical protein